MDAVHGRRRDHGAGQATADPRAGLFHLGAGRVPGRPGGRALAHRRGGAARRREGRGATPSLTGLCGYRSHGSRGAPGRGYRPALNGRSISRQGLIPATAALGTSPPSRMFGQVRSRPAADRKDPEARLNGFGATRASEPTTLKLPPRAAPRPSPTNFPVFSWNGKVATAQTVPREAGHVSHNTSLSLRIVIRLGR